MKKLDYNKMPLDRILSLIWKADLDGIDLTPICIAVSKRYTPLQLQEYWHSELNSRRQYLLAAFDKLYNAVLNFINAKEIEQQNKRRAKRQKRKKAVNTQAHYETFSQDDSEYICKNVRATEFSLSSDNQIVFRNKYYHLTTKDKSLFTYSVLSQIERTFTVKTINRRFQFCPSEDILRFYDELAISRARLRETNHEFRLQTFFEHIESCRQRLMAKTFAKYRRIYIHIPLSELSYDDSTRTYHKELDAVDYIIPSNEITHISYDDLEKIVNKWRNFHDLQYILYERYKDGIDIIHTQEYVYPELISTKIRINVPAIFIERLQEDELHCFASYADGLFNVSILSRIGTINCWEKVALQSSVKPRILESILSIDEEIAAMFYKSYCLMFNEGDEAVEEHISNIPNYNSYFQYVASDTTLSIFDAESNDWLWLSNKIAEKKFTCAYKFLDKNHIKSEVQHGTHPKECCCYIAIEAKSSDYIDVIMYALDEHKSVYHYVVKRSDVELAVFAIWSYFSSNLHNKRLNHDAFSRYFDCWGIVSMFKFPPLTKKAGLGFVGFGW